MNTSAGTGVNEPCRWCGIRHGPMCPTVKAMEFHQDGTIKRVEFNGASDYPAWTKEMLNNPRLTAAAAAPNGWTKHTIGGPTLDPGNVFIGGMWTGVPSCS